MSIEGGPEAIKLISLVLFFLLQITHKYHRKVVRFSYQWFQKFSHISILAPPDIPFFFGKRRISWEKILPIFGQKKQPATIPTSSPIRFSQKHRSRVYRLFFVVHGDKTETRTWVVGQKPSKARRFPSFFEPNLRKIIKTTVSSPSIGLQTTTV